MSQDIYHRVDNYISTLVAQEDEALAAARTASLEAGLPDIAICAAEGKFLHVLARTVRADRILEIGTLGWRPDRAAGCAARQSICLRYGRGWPGSQVKDALSAALRFRRFAHANPDRGRGM